MDTDENKKEESGLSSDLTEQIKTASKEAATGAKEEKASAQQEENKRSPVDEVQTTDDNSNGESSHSDGDNKSEEDDGGGGSDGSGDLSDELLERAVSAGLTLAEAKEYPSSALLAKTLDRIQANRGDDDSGSRSADEQSAKNDDDLFRDLPELDPEDYDENIVKTVNGLKGIITNQQKIIQGLQSGEQNQEKSWFESKVTGLGDSFDKAFKAAPEKRQSLQETFDALSAGYEAQGKQVGKDAIFDQAVSATLSDVQAEASTASKSKDLGKRSSQHISRPGGKGEKPKKDAYESTAEKLDRKFFNES